MNSLEKQKTEQTENIVKLLQPVFPGVEAYRYNPASIRVRIVDERFRGLSRPERDDMVEPYLRQLPEETLEDLVILLLLSPDEIPRSMMNVEFEYPSPAPGPTVAG
jgi:stress-induced morphogen